MSIDTTKAPKGWIHNPPFLPHRPLVNAKNLPEAHRIAREEASEYVADGISKTLERIAAVWEGLPFEVLESEVRRVGERDGDQTQWFVDQLRAIVRAIGRGEEPLPLTPILTSSDP